ncbi:uncharacterized protein LOC141784754 [Halichoeres trimaculatus]|uniref:uncharacterized protein LOC141784754 n=1 Tax=Halichoeres trimaculatus TaxID=147232 RepID=UPI003D9EDA93
MPFKSRDSFSKNVKKSSSMANETITQNSYIQETREADEGWESIPCEDSALAETLKLQIQVGDGVGYSSSQPWGENQPPSDTCTFSTPAPTTKGGVKAKSRLSGLPSALTPILKYLNIGNKRPSPGSRKQGNTMGQPNLDSFSSHGGPSLSMNASVSLLEDECLPEVTLFDVTCDSTMQVTRNDSVIPDSMPATAATARPVCPSVTTTQPSKLNASSRSNTSQMPNITIDDPPESTSAPLRLLDDGFFPEITLLEVTQDSPGMEKLSVNVAQDISPGDAPHASVASLELSGQPAADPSTVDNIQTSDLSTTLEDKATHVSSCSEKSNCVGPNVTKAPLELTRDISMSSLSCNSQSSLEPSGLNIEDISKDTLVTHPVNVTHDMSSSSDTSAQSAKTQLSTSDMQCDVRSEAVTSDALTEPVVILKTEESPTSNSPKCSSLSPKTAESMNDSVTANQPTKLSSPSNLSSTPQIPMNVTLDLAPSSINSPKAESGAKDLTFSLSGSTTKSSLEMNSSAAKAGALCEVQNATFDRNSLQKSSGNSTLGEAAAATFSLQSTTGLPHQQNGTITLSETSSGDSHHDAVDQTSSSKVCAATSRPQHPTLDVHPSEVTSHDGLASNPDHDAEKADNPEGTLDVNPAAEKASETSQSTTKSSSGLPVDREMEALSDTSVIQHRDLESCKVSSFNLDDTLDLAVGSLITSTPMPSCKTFSERDRGRIFGATETPHGDAPCKPGGQVTSEIPSNIIGDRKTFLTKPMAKSLLPSSKPASLLLKFKPALTHPGRLEPSASGLPMTRQRAQAEALRSSVACDEPKVASGTSSSYNLRTTTTESKQPNTGLRKPQSCGLSNIQRATVGLRPLSARSKVPAPSTCTGKLQAPTANPLTKISQAKKHPLTRAENVQVAPKKRKVDALLPSSNAEASTLSCDAANRAKNLKQLTTCQKALPAQKEDLAAQTGISGSSTSCDAVSRGRALKQPAASHRALTAKPQAHGCANCVLLEQQLKMNSEEIKRLKKELEKFRKEDKC